MPLQRGDSLGKYDFSVSVCVVCRGKRVLEKDSFNAGLTRVCASDIKWERISTRNFTQESLFRLRFI